MKKGFLIIVSAPSGCGKGTILKEILNDNKYYYSISATTRSPRDGEVHGVNYYFLSEEEFQKKIANDELLEYAKYCENYYGTPKEEVFDQLNNGKHVILEIEVQGAMQVKKAYPEAKLIFIAPPSIEELKRRLLKRNTESLEVIEERVAQAERELPFVNKYDYVIVNDKLEDAIDDFKSVVRACELQVNP